MGVKFPSPPMCRKSLSLSAYGKNGGQIFFLPLTYFVTLENGDPIIFRVIYNCRIKDVFHYCFPACLPPAPSDWEKTPISPPCHLSHQSTRLFSLPPAAAMLSFPSLSPLASFFFTAPVFSLFPFATSRVYPFPAFSTGENYSLRGNVWPYEFYCFVVMTTAN